MPISVLAKGDHILDVFILFAHCSWLLVELVRNVFPFEDHSFRSQEYQ